MTGVDGIQKRMETKNFEMKKCKETEFPGLETKNLLSKGVKFAICPQNFSTEIYRSSNEVRHIEILISLCEFEENPECKNRFQVENFLNETRPSFILSFPDSDLILQNYTIPLYNYLNSLQHFILPGFIKIQDLLLSNNYIETDQGLFFESTYKEKFIKIKPMPVNLGLPLLSSKINFRGNHLLKINFFTNHSSTSYYRKYIRIPEILAYVGGLIKVFLIVINLINYKFAEIEKDLIIINSLRDIENEYPPHINNPLTKISKSQLPLTSHDLSSINSRLGIKIFKEDRPPSVFNRSKLHLATNTNTNSNRRNCHLNFNLPTNLVNIQNQISMDSHLARHAYNSANNFAEVNKSTLIKPNNTIFPVTLPDVKLKKVISLSLIQKIKLILFTYLGIKANKADKAIKRYLEESVKLEWHLDLVNMIDRMSDLEKIKSILCKDMIG
jgi:hypothetical protein